MIADFLGCSDSHQFFRIDGWATLFDDLHPANQDVNNFCATDKDFKVQYHIKEGDSELGPGIQEIEDY